MGISPLPKTRYDMITEKRPSLWRRALHIGKQVAQVLLNIARKLLQKIAKGARFVLTYLFIPLLALSLVIYGVVRLITYFEDKHAAAEKQKLKEEKRAAKAAAAWKQTSLDQHKAVAYKNLDEWTTAYQGALSRVCTEWYGNEEPYTWTVSCHLGAKESLPSHLLVCTEFSCTLTPAK